MALTKETVVDKIEVLEMGQVQVRTATRVKEDGTVLSNWPKWLFHVYHLSHTLIVFNSAANFILYVVG